MWYDEDESYGTEYQIDYYYEGNKLIAEVGSLYRLDFLYDQFGYLYGMIKDNTYKYYYIRDILGNILGLVDDNGVKVVSYNYDSYGNLISKTDTSKRDISSINPFRFKGYYYDRETNLYYLMSRYYSPRLCRFIQPDSVEYLDITDLNGMNLYNFCANDPVNYLLKSDNHYKNKWLLSRDKSVHQDNSLKLEFAFGLLTSKNYDSPSWMAIYGFYVRGSIGLNYTVDDGFSFVNFGFGVLDTTCQFPKWFDCLDDDNLLNPNIYIGFGAWNVDTSVGLGLSSTAEFVSGAIGVQFGDSISLQAKGYVGIGATVDFTNGIKIGGGLIISYEISINFDWSKIF